MTEKGPEFLPGNIFNMMEKPEMSESFRAITHYHASSLREWVGGTLASDVSAARGLQNEGVRERQTIGRALLGIASLKGSREEAGLRKRINNLEKEVVELRGIVSTLQKISAQDTGPVVELRDISYEDAKAEITQYFSDHHGQDLDADDIQDALRIDIDTVIQVCEELEQEGQIRGL